jgi:hypothetical protein
MAKLQDYIKRYDLDMRHINSFLNTGRTLYSRGEKMSTRGHLSKQANGNMNVVSNIMGVMRGIRRAKRDVEALKAEMVDLRQVKGALGEQTADTTVEEADRLSTIRDFVLSQPLGKVGVSSFGEYFGQPHLVKGAELTPKEYISGVLAERYAEAPVIAYNSTPALRADLGYQSTMIVQDVDGKILSILMDLKNDQFDSASEQVVAALTTHALDTGITAETSNLLNDLKANLDRYFLGDYINAQVDAEVRMLAEMTENFSPTDDVFAGYKERSAQYQRQSLDKLAPQMNKLMGWAKSSTDTATHFAEMSDTDFIMQVLFNPQMRHFAGNIAAGNTLFNSLAPFISDASLAEAQGFLEAIKMDRFSSGQASVAGDQIENLGDTEASEVEDTESENLGSTDTRTTDEFDLPPSSPYITTYYSELDNTTSPFPAVVAMALEAIRGGEQAVNRDSIKYSGLRSPDKRIDANTMSVADFFDYSFVSKQKDQRTKVAIQQIWGNLVDARGISYKGELTLNTTRMKWVAIQRGNRVSPRIGKVSDTELKIYDDAYKAALEAYDGVVENQNALITAQRDTQDAIDVYEAYPDTKDSMYYDLLGSMEVIEHRLSYVEAELAGLTRDRFAVKTAQKAGVKAYEQRMLEKRALQKRASEMLKEAPAPLTPSLLYKSPDEMNIRLNDGVNRILEQADRVANEQAQSLFDETQDPGSYPTFEVAPRQEEELIEQNELGVKSSKSTPAENKKVPALKGGEVVPTHKFVGSASGVSRSDQDKQAGDEYTDRIKKRLYNNSPLYKEMMDNEANSPTAIALNGLIATVADVATNKKFDKDTRGSANFLLSRLVAGETSFFYKEANKLRSHTGSMSNIDSVINGINPNTKSNWFTHQDAQITDLFYKDKQAYRHGLMMMAEQDFGLYTNTGRNNWKRIINDLTERWTRTASKVGSELATKAYVGRLIANVASNSKASDIAQIERNLDAIEAGATLNKQAAGKLDRELLQQSDYALEMVAVARNWISLNDSDVDAASLDAYLLASLGNGAKAKMARQLIDDATEFFDSHKWGMSMMAEMQGKKIGMYDRYLPMRGYDIGGNPMDGMDGVEGNPYADMSHSQERSRYEWDDQTRGLDFNPLRALLAGANATLYHVNTFDSLEKAKHDFGSEGVDSQYTRNALASEKLTDEQKAAVQVMNNVMRNEVERQRSNDVTHSQHSGKILSAFSSLSTMGYRASLTSLSQMYLQTLPGAISYITSNPAKGVRLVDNMMRMLGSAPQGLYNNLQDNNHSAYMNDVAALIKRVSPELYARSLDGITELKDNLAKLNMAEVKGVGDLLTTGVGSTYKGVNKIYDMLLHLSTGAPDSFLVRAMFATEYEMETGKRIDSTTAANFDKQAAVMARVESEARMAQSDASKKATIFQPVAMGGSVGYSLEVARKSTLVFGNHMLSLAPRVKTGLKMMAPGSDNKAYGARIVSDFIMQAALFNGMKIRNLAFIVTYLLMPPPDEDELEKLKKKQALSKKGEGDKLTKEEKKRLVMLGREMDHYAEQFDVKQKAILDSYHSIPFTGEYSRPYTKDDVMYSFALKTGIDLLGGTHAALAIPMLNGRVLDAAKELTYRTTGVKYAGMQERHMDFYTDKIEYAGAAGIALNKMVNFGSTYAHAKRDYELSWTDAQYAASIFGGSREVSSALEKEIRKRNDTFVFKQDRRTKKDLQAPDLFSSRPHSFRGYERMPRPEGVENYMLNHHPDAAVTLDMYDGMELHDVDLMNRPWGDGDSVPFSKGLLNSQTYRFVGIDTLETKHDSKEMKNRVYKQSLDTGIQVRDITRRGGLQSYITQHAFDSADKVKIATMGKAAFERDVKSTERHDAVLLIQKDGVWYDHGLSMAYNGDAAVTKYGLSRLPKKLKGEMYDRYGKAKQVADETSQGTMYPQTKKPKKKQVKPTKSLRTKTRNMGLLRRIRG